MQSKSQNLPSSEGGTSIDRTSKCTIAVVTSPTKGSTGFHDKLERVLRVREVQEGSPEEVTLEEQKLTRQRGEGEGSFQAKGQHVQGH